MINVRNSSRGRSQGYPKIFRAPMETYRAHCAVIFAIAQLSCLHLYLLFYSRLSCKRITVMLYSNFQIFRYLGNGFWSETNYIAQLRSMTPEQPLGYLVENRGHISYTRRLTANFLLKFSNFRYHGNRDRLSKV